MSIRYRVVLTETFQADIERLEEHIVQRDLASHAPDDTCRRSEAHRAFRELIVPFGHGGRVFLFAIRDFDVVLLAARDQHEHDYR